MDSYEINKDTCAVISINDEISKVLENNDEYLINKSSFEVMEDSCEYYGSTCEGRNKGSRKLLGSNYKVPIIIEETNDIININITIMHIINNCSVRLLFFMLVYIHIHRLY